MIQEISFILFAGINFLRAGKQDVIVVFTTPINLGLVGVLFRKLWGSKLLINIQDLQLDAAKSLGMLNKLPIVSVMNHLERYSYEKSDVVSSISTAMVGLVDKKGIEKEKTYLWPNWINVAEANSHGTKGSFRSKFPQYADKIIIGYAGNIGVKQGLSVLVDLSERFKHRKDLIFLIIGQGGDVDNLKKYASQKGTTNLDFIDFLSQEEYYNFLSDVDVVFISQKKDSGDVYFPSKLLGIMAKEKLTFVSADVDSEIYKVITENKLGITSDFGKIDQLEEQLTDYLNNPENFAIYRTNAYRYVQQFDREYVLDNVLKRIAVIN
jgi:colanic acid biosynthesis glycosyl transferase WcaI